MSESIPGDYPLSQAELITIRRVTQELVARLGRKVSHNGPLTEIELAKKEKDTSSYVSNCDSLSNEVVNQAGVIQQMEWYLGEVVKYNDSILTEKDKQYNDLQTLHSTTLNSFDFVSEQNLLLGKKVNQLQRKEGRKYSLAISAGYGIGLIGGPQPFVGITISRPIFKFKL